MLTKLQTFSLTSSLYIKYAWPDIYPESWFILEFSQLELKQSPNLRSIGLTRRTLTCHPALASIPFQEQDTLLPAAASSKPKPQCHYHLPILALLAPHPSRAHVHASTQIRSRMSETFSFAVCIVSFQSSEMRLWDQERALALVPPILWLWCLPKKLPSLLVYSEALELWMCSSKEHKLTTANIKSTRDRYLVCSKTYTSSDSFWDAFFSFPFFSYKDLHYLKNKLTII